jgi:hypothetical protein
MPKAMTNLGEGTVFRYSWIKAAPVLALYAVAAGFLWVASKNTGHETLAYACAVPVAAAVIHCIHLAGAAVAVSKNKVRCTTWSARCRERTLAEIKSADYEVRSWIVFRTKRIVLQCKSQKGDLVIPAGLLRHKDITTILSLIRKETDKRTLPGRKIVDLRSKRSRKVLA